MPFTTVASYTREHRLTAALSVFSVMLEVYCDLQQPQLMSLLVDEVARSRDLGRAATIGQTMVLYAVLGLIAGVSCAWFSNRASLGFAYDLRRALFVRVQSFEAPEIDRLTTASLITRLSADTSALQQTFSMMLQVMVRAPVLLLGGLLKAVAIDLRLASVLLGAVPLIVMVLARLLPEGFRRSRMVQTALDVASRIVQECLHGIRVIKAQERAPHVVERFRVHNQKLAEEVVHAAFVTVLFQPLLSLVMNLCVALVLVLAGHSIVTERLTLGQAMAFVTYLNQILSSVVMSSMLVMLFSRSRASYERVTEVLAAEPSIATAPGPRTAPPSRGRLQFHDVGFTRGGGECVLSGLSFVVEPGTRLGVVGGTGSGKSTLVSLIPRLLDVTDGRITYDGVDVRDYDLQALRSTIGFVPQSPQLFSGTVRDNVELGRPAASDGTDRALALAQATEFVSLLPQNRDTVLTHGGKNLSGGQRQRLCIARALVSAPRLLVLDDASSALDTRTESRLLASLQQLDRETTLIVISGRISSVRQMDRILVLERGRLVADGTHGALIETSTVYRELLGFQEPGAAECPA